MGSLAKAPGGIGWRNEMREGEESERGVYRADGCGGN